jgi:hypothetical protein
MPHGIEHWPAVWKCMMGRQRGQTSWTCNVDMQEGHAALGTHQFGHAAWRHGHAAWGHGHEA